MPLAGRVHSKLFFPIAIGMVLANFRERHGSQNIESQQEVSLNELLLKKYMIFITISLYRPDWHI